MLETSSHEQLDGCTRSSLARTRGAGNLQGLVRGVWQTGSAVLVRDVAANPRVYLAPARKSTKAQRVSAERSLLDAAAAGAPTASPAEEEAEEQAEGAEGEAADGAKAEAEAEAEAELEAEAEEAVAERKKIAQEFKDSAVSPSPFLVCEICSDGNVKAYAHGPRPQREPPAQLWI